jgi:hypothetical protein
LVLDASKEATKNARKERFKVSMRSEVRGLYGILNQSEEEKKQTYPKACK